MSGKYPWQEDEGETGYPQYGMAYGGYQPQAAPNYEQPAPAAPEDNSGTTNPNPYIAGGSLALQAVGTGLKAYGAYEQKKQSDRDYQLQRDDYAFDQAISLEDRRRAEDERRRRAEMEAGNYAGNYLDRAVKNYGNYSSMRG